MRVRDAVALREEEGGPPLLTTKWPREEERALRICCASAAILREEEGGSPLFATDPEREEEGVRICLGRLARNLVR